MTLLKGGKDHFRTTEIGIETTTMGFYSVGERLDSIPNTACTF